MTDIQAVKTDAPVKIVAVIDRSGSMSNIKDETIGGYNAFVEEQQALDGKATITTVIFDHEYEMLQDSVDIQEAMPLDASNYVPRGYTALFDAIGNTINKLLENHAAGELSGGVIMTILTDGQENASKEFTANQIKTLITDCESKYGWSFVFLAANQDAFAVGSSFGISADNAMNFMADGQGVAKATRSMSAYATNYRSSVAAPKSVADDSQ